MPEQIQPKRMNLMQLTFIVAVNMLGSGIIIRKHGKGRRDILALWTRPRWLHGDCLRLCPGASSTSVREACRHMRRMPTEIRLLPGFLYFLSLAIGNVAMAYPRWLSCLFLPLAFLNSVATCVASSPFSG
jgi:putrescine:ornithine antiporter